MRLIYADKLKAHYAWWGSENASDELKERKKDFDDIIDVQPTVEAEPIRHGKWIFKEGYITCSVCEAQPYKDFRTIDFDNLFKHCPCCGAKMDGKEAGENET